MTVLDLRDRIRDVPDFPSEGVVFKDLMPLIADPEYFAETIHRLADWARPREPALILGAEARGFIFGAALAYALGAGFIAARKPGKLPRETVEATYALEYGTDSLHVHRDAVTEGARVVVLDDVLATGGTARAKVELVEEPRRDRRGRTLRHRARFPERPRASRGLRRELARALLAACRPGALLQGEHGPKPVSPFTPARDRCWASCRRCSFHECRRAHESRSYGLDADTRGCLSPRCAGSGSEGVRARAPRAGDRPRLRGPPRGRPERQIRLPPRLNFAPTEGRRPPRRRTKMKIAAAATSATTNAIAPGTSDGERTEPHVEEEHDRPDEGMNALVDAGGPQVHRAPILHCQLRTKRIHRAGGAFVHSTR